MAKILCSAMGLVIGLAGICSAAVQPVAWYRLGEDDPGASAPSLGQPITLDHGAAHLDLTRSGTPHYSSDVAPGAAAATGSTLSMQLKAASFDLYWRNPIPLPADNIGIETWVKTASEPSSGAEAVIAYDGISGTNGMGLLRTTNATPFGGTEGVYEAVIGSTTIGFSAVPAGQWVHLALVRSGGADTFYVNGQAAGSGMASITDPSLVFSIGAQYCPLCGSALPGTKPFDGNVDEVRLFTFQPGQFDPATDLLYSAVPEPAALAFFALSTATVLPRRRTAD